MVIIGIVLFEDEKVRVGLKGLKVPADNIAENVIKCILKALLTFTITFHHFTLFNDELVDKQA